MESFWAAGVNKKIKLILIKAKQKTRRRERNAAKQGDKEIIVFYIFTTCQLDKFPKIYGGSGPHVEHFLKFCQKDAPYLTNQNSIIK